MDKLFDGSIQFAYAAIKVNAIQMIIMCALRFMTRSFRAQAGYDAGIAWGVLGALFWIGAASLLVVADLAVGGNFP